MSRKALILCIAALTVMMIAVGVAVAFLYSGVESPGKSDAVGSESRFVLLSAVPSDAVAVCCLSEASDVSDGPLSGFTIPAALQMAFQKGELKAAASSRFAVSLHFVGKLVPLYVFDSGKSAVQPSEDTARLMDFLNSRGLFVRYVPSGVHNRSVVIASPMEVILNSSHRHIEQKLSIMDVKGFPQAADLSPSDDLIFLANSSARTLLRGCIDPAPSNICDFSASLCEWTVLDIKEKKADAIHASIMPSYSDDVADFMNVLDVLAPAPSKASSMLPSYTSTAVVLPLADPMSYIEAYKSYVDSKQGLSSYNAKYRRLQQRSGLAVETYVKRLGIKEVVSASMLCGGGIEKVNLVRVSRADTMVAHRNGVNTLEECEGKILPYELSGFAGAAFGPQWNIRNESFFTYKDGWIISGSHKAVEEYATTRALEYTLKSWLSDAGLEDRLSTESVVSCYLGLNDSKRLFREDFYKSVLSRYAAGEVSPLFVTMKRSKRRLVTDLHICTAKPQRTHAPKFQRDTVVIVPAGPFTVRNSATGKDNLIYQNKHLSICLRDENGKDQWGIVFKEPICGTVHNLDYFGNGKLQMVFGAGSRIYLVDRLGTFVNGFPVDLGKDILLGPDIYDFSGANAYNIMVLHKDNTIEMYNLKAKKPSSWKGITHKEKIKSLPERLLIGGRNFWVVRTSIQTLIYPFNGGEPITAYEGDKMIRPDSEVKIIDSSSVEVACYDGQKRIVKLK